MANEADKVLQKCIAHAAGDLLKDRNKQIEYLNADVKALQKENMALKDETAEYEALAMEREGLEDMLDNFTSDLKEGHDDLAREMHSLLDEVLGHIHYELFTVMKSRIKDIKSSMKCVAKAKKRTAEIKK